MGRGAGGATSSIELILAQGKVPIAQVWSLIGFFAHGRLLAPPRAACFVGPLECESGTVAEIRPVHGVGAVGAHPVAGSAGRATQPGRTPAGAICCPRGPAECAVGAAG